MKIIEDFAISSLFKNNDKISENRRLCSNCGEERQAIHLKNTAISEITEDMIVIMNFRRCVRTGFILDLLFSDNRCAKTSHTTGHVFCSPSPPLSLNSRSKTRFSHNNYVVVKPVRVIVSGRIVAAPRFFISFKPGERRAGGMGGKEDGESSRVSFFGAPEET